MKLNKFIEFRILQIPIFFFIAFFLNSLIWLILVPIWHFPDEQAHFAQIAFIAGKGRNPDGNEMDLTKEIYVSETLLGTQRDKFGNNKFTFHPEYRIEYTNSLDGKYEASLSALLTDKSRVDFIHREASRYQPLYYWPAAILYKVFHNQNLFVRIFLTRFWSLVLFCATLVFVYKIGKLLFIDQLSSLSLAMLVGFQPMMVFANVGVNSDALGNLLFTVFIYYCLKIVMSEFNVNLLIKALLMTILVIYSKPQFIIAVPLMMILLIGKNIRNLKKQNILSTLLLIFLVVVITYLSIFAKATSPSQGILVFVRRVNLTSLVNFMTDYTIPHTFREVIPWYWGVYNWLGVTYPRFVHRIINRVLLVSCLGILLWLVQIIKRHGWKSSKVKGILFLNIIEIIFFLGVSFYDWLLWYTSKYQLGIQGRYYFPVISITMSMLLIGWKTIFPDKYHLKEIGIKLLALLMVALNYYALYTVAKAYYDISGLDIFIQQVSQYKPWFTKGLSFFLIFVLSLVFHGLFIYKYLKIPYEREEKV